MPKLSDLASIPEVKKNINFDNIMKSDGEYE